MKVEPMVEVYMTKAPEVIDSDRPLRDAQGMMDLLDIRHLPVVQYGKVIGIISNRDIQLAIGMNESSASSCSVDEICHKELYIVDPQTPMRKVAAIMAIKRYGSAIVMDGDALVGIFTTVDACRALSSLLESNAPHK